MKEHIQMVAGIAALFLRAFQHGTTLTGELDDEFKYLQYRALGGRTRRELDLEGKMAEFMGTIRVACRECESAHSDEPHCHTCIFDRFKQ